MTFFMVMKSVLIIGGGPAGLVAAKTLVQCKGSPFRVTLFEAASRVGGMWRARQGEKGDKCSPEMRTNLSRFTVAFPDLPWQQVDLGDEDAFAAKGRPPMFPKAHQVGLYLEEYARRFVPKETLVLNRRVLHAKQDGISSQWVVTSRDTCTNTDHTDKFDLLVIASGFFDKPRHVLQNGVFDSSSPPLVQHSADFRHISSFGDNPGDFVVVGGGISGSEAAATAALQVSNAKFAPGKSKPVYADAKVCHVFDRPFYVLPRYVPSNPVGTDGEAKMAPNFLPTDLNLYELSRRGTSEITATNGLVPPERAPKTHQFIRGMLGTDYSDLGCESLVFKDEQMQYPPYTGIADTYAEFVRSGVIVPVQGKAVKKVDENGTTSIDIEQTGKWTSKFPASGEQPTSITNIAGIIEATGYEGHLDYLSDDVLAALDHDESCDRVPFLLTKGSIFAPKIPEIAFVGFYEGPYWAVMEAQTRLIAQTWSSNTHQNVDLDVSLPILVREGLKQRDLGVPQFWMADYVGLVEELSREAGYRRNDSCFDGQTGPLFPARYTGPGTDLNAAEQTVREVRDLIDASKDEARFVAAATFRGMQGKWHLHRTITSRHASAPGGILEGTAHFHPRDPTAPHFSAEYLYIEEGTFTMDNGYAFTAKRRYIYRYSEVKDAITAWFVAEDGETVEKFFNEWVFERPKGKEQGWIAKGKHWCDPDMYHSACEFRFRGAEIEKMGITYEVKGPSKDYTHESWYRRTA